MLTPSLLLGPGDPPAVTVHNPNGAAPGIILCDHASNQVPMALGQLGLQPQEMARHIAYDIGAQGIAEYLSDALDMPAVIAGFSRLVIDLNRPDDDYTLIREIYDGSIVPGNRRLTPEERQARIDEIFRPYHDAITQVMARKSAEFGVPAVISVHSCTDLYLGEYRPWHIGVLSNRDRRMADRVLEGLVPAQPDLMIGDNKPYSGMSPYGYTIESHALPQGRPNVLFEIRQDLIVTQDGQNRFGAILAPVLQDVLADPTLFTRFQA